MVLQIGENDILNRMKKDNPWWSAGSYTPPYSDKKRQYFAPFCKACLQKKVRRSVVLMGQRRIGKTVMLQQLVQEAMTQGIPSAQILMLSLDVPLYSNTSLEAFLNLYSKACAHDANVWRLVIFDEIQYLKDWERHLKVLTDQFPDTRFVVSGSAAAALKRRSQESGAGRFTDFFLPPLNFAEFLDFLNISISKPFDREMFDTLHRHFLDYINFGGYPEAVLNASITENFSQYAGRDIVDKVLNADLPSLYGIADIIELKRLFTSLAYGSGQEVSLDNLSQQSGISKPTIKKYIEYLEAAFLIFRLRRIDYEAGTFKREHRFKVYLSNPAMRAALFLPLEEGDEAMGRMVENAVIAQHYSSKADKNSYAYASWKEGRKMREVDFVALETDGTVGGVIEVKASNRSVERIEELQGLIDFARKHRAEIVVCTSKSHLKKNSDNGIWFVPASLHSYSVAKTMNWTEIIACYQSHVPE